MPSSLLESFSESVLRKRNGQQVNNSNYREHRDTDNNIKTRNNNKRKYLVSIHCYRNIHDAISTGKIPENTRRDVHYFRLKRRHLYLCHSTKTLKASNFLLDNRIMLLIRLRENFLIIRHSVSQLEKLSLYMKKEIFECQNSIFEDPAGTRCKKMQL